MDNNSENPQQISPLLPSTYNGVVNGLEFLRTTDTLFVKQHSALTEAIFGIPVEAKFDIFNDKNERILQGLETSGFFQRLFCTKRRGFTFRIINNINQEIILLKREFKCCSGLYCCANINCCSQEVIVESPPGTLIGTVSQIASCWRVTFEIKDVNDTTALTLVGPYIVCDGLRMCGCSNKFALIGTDGITEVGAIYKKYGGYLQEATTSADSFVLKVPLELDVKMKAVTLAALFLIDFMLFSTVPSRH